MNVERCDDAVRFLAEAEPLLLADEARHNLILGIAGTIRDAPDAYPEHDLWLVRDGDEVGAAALRTPPYNLVLARPRSSEALAALAAAVGDVPGVVGALPEADEFAALWAERHGGRARTVLRSGVYALDAVQPLDPPEGGLRAAAPGELDLLLEWYVAFTEEALPEEPHDPDRYRNEIERRLASDTAGIDLWEVGGRPVSLSAYGSPTPSGVRIGPVYTPPGLRGRGYATGLVAEQSARLLAGGRRFCFLYTDLANPTANAIYERIGYRRVCDSVQLLF